MIVISTSASAIVRCNNAAEFGFIEAERFFAEDMFAGVEGCDHLRRVQMMARSDDDSVDRGLLRISCSSVVQERNPNFSAACRACEPFAALAL